MAERDDPKRKLTLRSPSSRESSQNTEGTRESSDADFRQDTEGDADVRDAPYSGAQGGPAGRLRDDPIEEKVGNYLLTFGFSGSGKTILQSFLAYYLTHVGPFDAQVLVDPEASHQGWAPMALYNAWMRRWRNGEMPRRTDTKDEDIRELSFAITPKVGVKTPVTFSFLEISGELMKTVIAEQHDDPRISKTLGRYFENPNISIILCLVIDPEMGHENDLLFQNLISFLETNWPDYQNRMGLSVLISKPELSLSALKAFDSRFKHYSELRGDVCEHFVKTFAPRTYKILDAWPDQKRVQIMSLYLGESEGHDARRGVERPDYRDIEAIFSWLYFQFTGSTLGRRWWQKAWDWLRE